MSDLTVDDHVRTLKHLAFCEGDQSGGPEAVSWALDCIEALEAEVERSRLDLSISEDKLAHATQAVVALRARVPNPDDLRLLCDFALGGPHTPWPVVREAQTRVRATLEGA